MSFPATEPLPRDAAQAISDPDALRLLASLVSIAPTNLEEPVNSRWEKPNYLRASEQIVRWARRFGLKTRIFDPLTEGPDNPSLRGIPRPNVIVDLDVGAKETVLILAHYDVVPVPAEQLPRWKSPPHVLTWRGDSRLYGRGSNDDLGSGVVSSLLAMKRLADRPGGIRNVRLLACCDEETGGSGGVESIKSHDESLPAHDPDRMLEGVAALIPDGSQQVTAGSCGVAFVDAKFDGTPPISTVLSLGAELVRIHQRASLARSIYAAPDWPEDRVPAPVITGRATVTQWDVESISSEPAEIRLLRVHAETDAANQIAQSVTLVFGGPGARPDLEARLRLWVLPPYHLTKAGATSLTIPAGAIAVQLVGQSAHGGYPHRGHNPVPAAMELLRSAVRENILDGSQEVRATFAVDLRLIPEAELDEGTEFALGPLRAWIALQAPTVRIATPPDRCRRGSALPIDHPVALRLERLVREIFGVQGVVGEYGGTDASSLVGIKTPTGEPLPAVVFGSMDRQAHIHEADESVDPSAIAKVAKVIERFVREP